MEPRTRQYACLGLAATLLITGTLATGLLPSGAIYQAIAGGIIVAAFAVGYGCLGAFDFEES